MTTLPLLDASSPVRYEVRGAVLEVTLDRPKANAIDACGFHRQDCKQSSGATITI